jgi:hypothetical protein
MWREARQGQRAAAALPRLRRPCRAAYRRRAPARHHRPPPERNAAQPPHRPRRRLGLLDIVADAWDQVDNNEPRRRLGLYKAGFQILKADGTPLPGYAQPRITIEFDRMPTTPDAVKILYAPDSGDTVHSDQPTRILYVVSNVVRHGRAERGGWDPARLAAGDYAIRGYAADRTGNVASTGRELSVTIR